MSGLGSQLVAFPEMGGWEGWLPPLNVQALIPQKLWKYSLLDRKRDCVDGIRALRGEMILESDHMSP